MNTNEHYPKDFQEFIMQFKNEEDCWKYIYEMRCRMVIFVLNANVIISTG